MTATRKRKEHTKDGDHHSETCQENVCSSHDNCSLFIVYCSPLHCSPLYCSLPTVHCSLFRCSFPLVFFPSVEQPSATAASVTITITITIAIKETRKKRKSVMSYPFYSSSILCFVTGPLCVQSSCC